MYRVEESLQLNDILLHLNEHLVLAQFIGLICYLTVGC